MFRRRQILPRSQFKSIPRVNSRRFNENQIQLYNKPLSLPNFVPRHLIAPRVTRSVRIVTILNTGAPTYTLTYNKLALQDASDYLGSSTLRYDTMRVNSVKVWLESPAALAANDSSVGLILTDVNTGYAISDRPTVGSRMAKASFLFALVNRNNIVATSSTNNLVTVTTDIAIASTVQVVVTIDTIVEFS